MRRVEPYSIWIGHAGEFRTPRLHAAYGIMTLVNLAIDESPLCRQREMVPHRIPLLDGTENPA